VVSLLLLAVPSQIKCAAGGLLAVHGVGCSFPSTGRVMSPYIYMCCCRIPAQLAGCLQYLPRCCCSSRQQVCCIAHACWDGLFGSPQLNYAPLLAGPSLSLWRRAGQAPFVPACVCSLRLRL
jgi:hypothetical protein